MIMWKCLGLCLCLVLSACTKKPNESSGQVLVTPVQNPDRIIFEANVTLSRATKVKLKSTDIFLWDLKNEKGEIVAFNMVRAPKFPYQLKVQAKQLVHAIPENTILLFAARVVHFGEERKPPMKGQLNAMVGVVPSKEEVVNPNVDQKRFEKWAKKNHVSDEQVLKIGSKVDATLSPSLW